MEERGKRGRLENTYHIRLNKMDLGGGLGEGCPKHTLDLGGGLGEGCPKHTLDLGGGLGEGCPKHTLDLGGGLGEGCPKHTRVRTKQVSCFTALPFPCTVFLQSEAAATIHFAARFVRLLFEGGVYFFGKPGDINDGWIRYVRVRQ